MNKTIVKAWLFASSSNPEKKHETLLYHDGSTSCNCFGWTKRSARSCRHTRLVEMDPRQADREAVSFRDFGTPPPKPAPPRPAPVVAPIAPERGRRAFDFAA